MLKINMMLDKVLKLYGEIKLDIIKIHGDLNIQFLKERKTNTSITRSIAVKLEKMIKTAWHFDPVLIDSYSKGRIGSIKITHSWSISHYIRDTIYPKSLILAEDLNTENVKNTIKAVKSYTIDDLTGVEVGPRVKDSGK